jgi:hypothetical protein
LNEGRSLVGGMVTAVHRNLEDDVARATLRSDALSGGTDFRHEFSNRAWMVRGDAEGSLIRGTPASIVRVQTAGNHFFQRPDATHLGVDPDATSLFGYSAGLGLVKQGGEHWRGDVAGAVTSPGYEVNDMGFAVRTDRRDAQLSIRYQENQPGTVWRRWNVLSAVRSEHNFANEPILTFAFSSLTLQTLNYWTVQPTIERFFLAYDDRLTRGGPLALRPGWTTAGLFISSDARKPITAQVFGNYTRTEANGSSWFSQFTLGFKSSTWWNLSIGPTLTGGLVPAQFVTTVPDASYTPTYGVRYIFARLHQTELGIETRFNATFTPKLSFESYVQPLISSGNYGQALQLVAPRTFDFAPYTPPVPDRDFNFRSLRGNAVLRWEWREGSTMFVAWQQSRATEEQVGDFSFNRDRRALFGTRPDNILLVKINYWLNP